MPPTDIAHCRECGSHNMAIRWDAYRSTWHYKCLDCGHTTPHHSQLHAAADDVDWRPAHEVRLK